LPFNDETLKHIRSFHPVTAALALQFIDDLRAAGIPAYIGQQGGRRSQAEQSRLVASGASRTYRSKHLDGRAFDIDILGYGRDQLPRWWWDAVGRYGKSLGLKWGGDFKGFYDAGHFET